MSLKNTSTTSDFLDFDTTLNKATKILKSNDKKFKIAFLIIVGINLGLRISDLLKLKYSDLENDFINITEQKTGKHREIKINNNIKNAYEIFKNKIGKINSNAYIFISQKGSVYSVRHVNRLLKSVLGKKGKNISSHSLRKTFGRRVWENDNESERALIMLSKIFNHSSTAITRIYLGIQKEEIDDIYMNL